MRSRKFPGLVAAASLVLGLIVGSPITASAGNELNCPGGPIPPGTYDSIDVSGFCLVVGPVTVKHDVTVVGGGVLLALFGAGTLVVGGNMKVESGGSAAVGCEPEHFPCFDSPSGITNDTIAGSVLADHAVLLLFHHDTIGKNVEEHSGGGGLTCASLPAFGPNGPPPYSTYEDDTIGGNASVTDLLGRVLREQGRRQRRVAQQPDARPGRERDSVQHHPAQPRLLPQCATAADRGLHHRRQGPQHGPGT